MSTIPEDLSINIKPARAETSNALIGAALRLDLRGRLLWGVRLVWLGLVVVTLGVFLLTIQARFSQLVIMGTESFIALQQLGLPANFFVLYIGVMDAVLFLTYLGVGMLIFARKSNEWIGLFASLALIATGVTVVRPGDSVLLVDSSIRLPLLFVFALGNLAITVFVYIFPDGRFVPRWLQWFALALSLYIVFNSFVEPLLANPMPWPPSRFSPVIVVGLSVGVAAQLYRYRRVASPSQRQQTKWVIAGLTIALLGVVLYLIVVPQLVPAVSRPGSTRVAFLLFGVPVLDLSLLMLPVTLAVSILRYRLWDISLLLSRTLTYVPLTAILAGLFAVFESLAQEFFIALTGQRSDFATVLSTLLVVATFTPLKDFLKAAVEKRFGRTTDPPAHIRAFAERINTRVTPLYAPQLVRRMLAEMVTAYRAKGGAAYLTRGTESHLIHTLGAWDGEAALCIPLAGRDGMPSLGVIALDDRENDAPYTEEDRRRLTDLAEIVVRAIEEDLAADRDKTAG